MQLSSGVLKVHFVAARGWMSRFREAYVLEEDEISEFHITAVPQSRGFRVNPRDFRTGVSTVTIPLAEKHNYIDENRSGTQI